MNTKRKYGARFLRELKEERRVRESMEIIEQRLAELEESLGRELSKTEEEGLLDMVDELTPKDKHGDYLYDLIPFDYAWEAYHVKRERAFKNLLNKKSP